MSPQKTEPLEDVLKQYDIKVVSIKNESYKEKKGVWWIETTDGYKILKKISNSEETLIYILSAIEHLCSKGINIPEVNKNCNNGSYVNIDGTCYVLSDAIHGRNPSYSSPDELAIVVRELARFHKASEGFTPPEASKPKYHLGLWVEDYKSQVEDMNNFYKDKVSCDRYNPASKVIINEFPYFYEKAHKAIDELSGREYNEWVAKINRTGCLCHQDFAAGNLILKADGRLFILDTDSITIDIPARDLRKLLNKIMKKAGKWDLELNKRILQHYQSENPLSASEWSVLRMDLMFPHLFLGAMNKYCYQRDKEWSTDKYIKRLNEMAAFEKTKLSVLEKFDSIIPNN